MQARLDDLRAGSADPGLADAGSMLQGGPTAVERSSPKTAASRRGRRAWLVGGKLAERRRFG